MFSGLAGPHLLILLLTWGLSLAVIGAAAYFVVRLAVLHALKAHTRWVDGGKQ
jgi:hypothetical protein